MRNLVWVGGVVGLLLVSLPALASVPNTTTKSVTSNSSNKEKKKRKLPLVDSEWNLRLPSGILLARSDLRGGADVRGVRSKKNRAVTKKKDPNRLEWGVLPAISGNTDIGFGFGILMNLARFAPGFYPYRWRIQLLVYMTAKAAPDGSIELPFHDYYVYFDFPGLAGGKLRIDGRVNFSRFTTAGYFGLGNGSTYNPPWLAEKYAGIDQLTDEQKKAGNQLWNDYLQARRYYQYDRIYPGFRVNARYFLPHKLSAYVGTEFQFNWINLYAGSKLEEDLKATNNVDDNSAKTKSLRELLFGVQNHPQWTWKLGLIYDSRDHEQTPTKGMFHDLSVRFSPGAAQYTYGGVTLNTRFFIPVFAPYLVVAVRLVGDALFGRVPFYEQARFGGLFPDDMTGGSVSLRGVLNRRYHGKIKLLGNVELRSKLIFFNIGSARFNIGVTAFFDAGRFWSDYSPRPELDGEDAGLKMTAGGGLRIQWGESFIIRADYGITFTETDYTKSSLPFTGTNTGLYIGVDQAF
jgi:hypothetical protein